MHPRFLKRKKPHENLRLSLTEDYPTDTSDEEMITEKKIKKEYHPPKIIYPRTGKPLTEISIPMMYFQLRYNSKVLLGDKACIPLLVARKDGALGEDISCFVTEDENKLETFKQRAVLYREQKFICFQKIQTQKNTFYTSVTSDNNSFFGTNEHKNMCDGDVNKKWIINISEFHPKHAHVATTIYFSRENTVEFFDSGGTNSFNIFGIICTDLFKKRLFPKKSIDFVIVNPDFNLQKGYIDTGYKKTDGTLGLMVQDIFCQTWIWWWVYQRINGCSNSQIIDHVKKMSDRDRLHYIEKYREKLIEGYFGHEIFQLVSNCDLSSFNTLDIGDKTKENRKIINNHDDLLKYTVKTKEGMLLGLMSPQLHYDLLGIKEENATYYHSKRKRPFIFTWYQEKKVI